MAVGDGGRFLVLADDEGGLYCVNRISLGMLWTRRGNRSYGCAVGMVGGGADERIFSVDEDGGCRLIDPATGDAVASFPLPGCESAVPHGHLLEVSWDHRHVVASCLQPLPPGLVAAGDAAAAHGLVLNVHDDGGHVVLLDAHGTELARTRTVTRPLAVGRSARVAYLRAPGHWVGVRDLLTDEEVTACRHSYERGGYAVALSPDERWVAWSGYEKYGTRDEVREFVRLVGVDPPERHGCDVIRGAAEFTDLRFSPDGTLLLVGDSEGVVSVVPVAEGGPRLLGAVEDGVAALDFADAATVVVLGLAGEICSWPVPRELVPG
jgi:hypothetical protein